MNEKMVKCVVEDCQKAKTCAHGTPHKADEHCNNNKCYDCTDAQGKYDPRPRWCEECPPENEILNFFKAIWQAGDVREIRAFDEAGYVKFGYFDSAEKAAKAAEALAASHTVYTTLNPVKSALLARAANRIKRSTKKDAATSDKDIAELRLVLTDCDPDRPSGISATEAEKAEALTAAKAVVAELGNPLLAGDSGNGYHLIYRHDAQDKEQIKAHLAALAGRHNGTVHIDTSVYNPARITKVLGTWARKGDNTAERPHRQSRILKIYDNPVTLHLPATPLPPGKKTTSTRSVGHAEFDARSWLAEHNVSFSCEKAGLGGTTLLILSGGCAFDPSHTEGEASIVLHPSGMVTYQCFHNSCKGRTWSDFRAQIGAPKTASAPSVCNRCGEVIEWKDGEHRPRNPDGTMHEHQTKALPALPKASEDKAEKEYAEQPEVKEKAPASGKLPSFPLHIYPDAIAEYCRAIAQSIPCPPDYPALAALAVMSTLVGDSSIAIKNSWIEQANLYIGIVAPTGSGKTPAIMAINNLTIYRIEEELAAQNKDAQDRYHQDLMNYEVSIAEWRQLRKQGHDVDAPAKPEPPRNQEIYTTDATTEALAEIMQGNTGLLLVKDEFSGWIHGMNQYKSNGKGEDLEFFLSNHSGAPAKVNRKGKAPILVNKPRLSILGGIVPKNLKLLSSKAEDGFFERILIIYPEPVPRKFDNADIPQEVITAAQLAFDGCRVSRQIALDERARLNFGTYYEDSYRGEYADYVPKLVSMTARFALILCCAWGKDSCDAEMMDAAIELAQYCDAHIAHVRREAGTSEEMHETNAIVKWAKRKKITLVQVRDLCMNHVSGCTSARAAREKIAELIDLGLGKWEDGGKFLRIL